MCYLCEIVMLAPPGLVVYGIETLATLVTFPAE